jgi:hypothetical protein
MNSREKDKCRNAYESYRKQKLGLKNFHEYNGWLACWEYHLTTRENDLAEFLDEYYNSEEGIEFMKKNGGLKDGK